MISDLIRKNPESRILEKIFNHFFAQFSTWKWKILRKKYFFRNYVWDQPLRRGEIFDPLFVWPWKTFSLYRPNSFLEYGSKVGKSGNALLDQKLIPCIQAHLYCPFKLVHTQLNRISVHLKCILSARYRWSLWCLFEKCNSDVQISD